MNIFRKLFDKMTFKESEVAPTPSVVGKMPVTRYQQLRKWGFTPADVAGIALLVERGQFPVELFNTGTRRQLRSVKYRKAIRKASLEARARYRQISEKLKEVKDGSKGTDEPVV